MSLTSDIQYILHTYTELNLISADAVVWTQYFNHRKYSFSSLKTLYSTHHHMHFKWLYEMSFKQAFARVLLPRRIEDWIAVMIPGRNSARKEAHFEE